MLSVYNIDHFLWSSFPDDYCQRLLPIQKRPQNIAEVIDNRYN